MAGCVGRIRLDRPAQHFHRDLVTAGGLRDHAGKIQGVRVGRIARQNLPADSLSLGMVAVPVLLAGFVDESGNARNRRARPGNGSGALCRTPLLAIHGKFFSFMANLRASDDRPSADRNNPCPTSSSAMKARFVKSG
jgi:hypothetical protein